MANTAARNGEASRQDWTLGHQGEVSGRRSCKTGESAGSGGKGAVQSALGEISAGFPQDLDKISARSKVGGGQMQRIVSSRRWSVALALFVLCWILGGAQLMEAQALAQSFEG